MTKQVVGKTKLKDTGERMVPEYHEGSFVYGEHMTRYAAAVALVKNKVVLDIASGSGYGSSMLAEAASQVYGVDADATAVAYAQKTYQSKNIKFIAGNGTSIPLDDNTVDVVVSFETIEHIDDYKGFMKEVKRVLRPDGLLVLSTPNDPEFSEGNHFHVHEFEHKELLGLVDEFFSNKKEYFQGTWLYNAVVDEQILTGKSTRLAIDTMQLSGKPLNKALYFFVLCSDRKINEVVPPIAAASQHWSAREEQEKNEAYQKNVDRLSQEIDRLSKSLFLQKHKLEHAEKHLQEIHDSKAFRLSRKLSNISATVKSKRA
jgi:2-polyprenyl-3-methyl-5-hydroxy-6-metoxy-1,4-benzoquinol methylase